MPNQINSVSLSEARRLIAAGVRKAGDMGVPSNVAVVDAGGNLVAFERMDGAWLGSIDIAIHKAWTARAFDMSTEDLSKMAQAGKPLFGIHATNHQKVVVFGGGIPLKKDNVVIGAVGSSGGTVDQDQQIAAAAAAALSQA